MAANLAVVATLGAFACASEIFQNYFLKLDLACMSLLVWSVLEQIFQLSFFPG